jgi:hypothetical protein
MRPRKPPLFIDLDETLIHARQRSGDPPWPGSREVLDYEVLMRPEARELLTLCRDGGREVYLFTAAGFGFALAASQHCGLGFTESSIFSLEMIVRCRRGLSPRSALIDNKPPAADPTRLKMEALGIGPTQVWVIPSYEPPRFPSARLFLLGLPARLVRLDCGAV